MKRDRIVGAGSIVTALFFFYHTRSIRVPANLVEPGPRLLPYIAVALMVICGLGMIMESFKGEEKEFLGRAGWKRLGVAYGTLFAYAIGLTILGFIMATPFMAYRLISMLSGEKVITARKKAAASIVVTAALYIVFTGAFGVMLPQGML